MSVAIEALTAQVITGLGTTSSSAAPPRGAWGVTETSRPSTTADALVRALSALGDALANSDHDAITACQAVIDTTSGDVRAAAVDASAIGNTLAPAHAVAVMAALARCRRLGFSLSLMAGQPLTRPDALRGYSPVGRPVSHGDGRTFLTARG